MNFNFIFLLLFILVGIIYLLNCFIFKNNFFLRFRYKYIVNSLSSFFPAFLFIFLVRSFIFEPFYVPSGSLEPTLMVGDFIIVNKFIYGLRSPIGSGYRLLFQNKPKRGDIIVFHWPINPKLNYVKRIIGIPGDEIVYHNKILKINKKIVKRVFLRYEIDESSNNIVKRYREILDNKIYDIYLYPNIKNQDFKIVIPKNYYFVMGDNRDNSFDSRFWGLVNDKYLIGKVMFVWISFYEKYHGIRWNRIGKVIY
ncbi:signal peptidase I [Candidatus Legionella polyplacis]|uniref:signal peptidase I n=1 Tax=Candidatus Legionella polyplacis TaxID=2005262 RepID=UPI000C1E51F7|nr:signal peptidase I [Candidatus Legionella polyplacis]ATW02048.1 signal peptidase I [Candidatus Legionella polyplacis]